MSLRLFTPKPLVSSLSVGETSPPHSLTLQGGFECKHVDYHNCLERSSRLNIPKADRPGMVTTRPKNFGHVTAVRCLPTVEPLSKCILCWKLELHGNRINHAQGQLQI